MARSSYRHLIVAAPRSARTPAPGPAYFAAVSRTFADGGWVCRDPWTPDEVAICGASASDAERIAESAAWVEVPPLRLALDARPPRPDHRLLALLLALGAWPDVESGRLVVRRPGVLGGEAVREAAARAGDIVRLLRGETK